MSTGLWERGEIMARIMRMLDKLEEVLMVGGMIIAVSIIFFQIILRFVFNTAIPWIEELARYLFIYFTWIGASAAILTDKHIRVEMFQEKFPNGKKYLEIASTLICLGIALFMFVNGWQLLLKMSKFSAVSPTMKIPMWICYMAIPVGGFLMSIKYLYKLITIDLMRLRKGATG